MHLARVVAPNLTFLKWGGCGLKAQNKSEHTGVGGGLARPFYFATDNHVKFAIWVDGP